MTREAIRNDKEKNAYLFEVVVARCVSEGLASGQRLAADASIIQADANRQNSTPQADWNPTSIDPEDAPRAVREYLATLDDAAFGAASPVKPKFTSHSDPASQWTGARGGPAYFAYSTNYLIDTDNGVILDVAATRSIRQAEVGSVRTMIERVSDTFGIKPERLNADTAYGKGEMLDWLVQKRGIAPHIPVIDKSGRKDGTFERADFTYDVEKDVYTCPGGKDLEQNHRAISARVDRDTVCVSRKKTHSSDARRQLLSDTRITSAFLFRIGHSRVCGYYAARDRRSL